MGFISFQRKEKHMHLLAYWLFFLFFAAISPTKGPEEKESCEVWNGWHDYCLADMHSVVPAALHVSN